MPASVLGPFDHQPTALPSHSLCSSTSPSSPVSCSLLRLWQIVVASTASADLLTVSSSLPTLPPTQPHTAPTGLVLSGMRMECVVDLVGCDLFVLIRFCFDRKPSLLLLALSPPPFPLVTSEVPPLSGLVSTVSLVRVLAFSRPVSTLLSPIMGPCIMVMGR